MTRKKTRVLFFTFLLSLCVLEFAVGKHGLTRFFALKREVSRLEYQKEELSSKLDAMKHDLSLLAQGEGVKDAAFKLGYQSEGEQVFYFRGEEREEPKEGGVEVREDDSSFFYLPLWANLLIALAITVIVVVWYSFKGERENG